MAVILRLQSLKRWNNELNDTIVTVHGMVWNRNVNVIMHS